ncbi:MAG: type IV pilus assembly protein PilM [Verrucomicrobia bacterium]|nr:type IV pilus assembly protein PilM [Verrucomicrobiota bacterium]
MADTQTSVVLNIGSQRVSMAVFETARTGALTLTSYGSESVSADPAMESTRVAQTRVAVADLAKRLKTGNAKVRYAISGQSVFTRFVKLPPLQQDNVEQLVTFEAQQHVPFPLNEVVWDYELVEGAAEKEAVIVAIKSDALDEINDAVNESGLGTAEVDVAPMALYNAFRANYGSPQEPVLLIDIGARTSNLLYIEGRRFFTRSIPVGGASITAAIAKEYNVPFLEAEHQKVANGLVALGGGHAGQLDEAVAALAMVIRNALGRLPSEIARTTNYYRSQHGGSAPRRVYLGGGGANLPYTLEFFQEKLNLPVEYFNPVGAITIGPGVDAAVVQREGHLMGELIGLALRGSGKSEINIDLVPAAVAKARAADRRKPFFIAAAAVLLGGLGAWAAAGHIAAGKAADQARTMDEQRDALAPVRTQIDGLLKRETALRAIAEAYVGTEADHAFWIDALAELQAAFASEAVWITDFEPLHGFDFQRALVPKSAAPKEANGVSVVRPDFTNAPYGTSALAQIQIKEVEAPKGRPGRGRPAAAAKPTAITANAVRVRGFWRENPKRQNLVTELLDKLREDSRSFRFESQDAAGKPMVLGDEQILAVTVEGNPNDLGMSFEIVLPLVREVAVR